MQDWENDMLELGEENNEYLQQQLALEHEEEIEIAIEQDEHPIEPETSELPEKKKLNRELRQEALSRLETSARTAADFKNVIAWWDKEDANRERRERYHELSRSGDDLPLDYGATEDGLCYPESLNGFLMRQLRKGDFIEAIFFCPYEIHQLVTEEYISKILYGLSDDHKDLLFHCAILQCSSVRIGKVRGQTDRNIRKIRATMLKKIQKKLLEYLFSGQRSKAELTPAEKDFMERSKKPPLDESKKG